jgi:serine/threonine protein kinase
MTTLAKTGRYQILDELGRGAMGVVYRAHDPVIGRDVAVKTMHIAADGSGATRPDFVTRFQTEARAAGILTHPNIVVVYDAGLEDGTFYITMELVEGRSLQSLLDEHQAFPLPRAVKIIEQASSALDYAHKHNIIHRDVKPANIMIAADDTVKVTDFGTAKILRFSTTQTAAVIGTPSYMSPEQIKGKTVDGRSDIFALGVILYELVTGEKPFPGQNITTVIYKIVNEEPVPPRELEPSIHPGLCHVIARALAKDPTARFQTCGELLEALKNYRNFDEHPKESSRPLRVATSPRAAKLVLKDVQPSAASPRPVGSIGLQNIARAVPVASAGHTLYESTSRRTMRRRWSTFWFSLLLLGVIAATGYYIRPYTDDVWSALRSVLDRQSSNAQPSAPATAIPASPAPATVVKNKTSKSAAVTPSIGQIDTGSAPAPTEKQKLPDGSPSADKMNPENAGGAAKVSESIALSPAVTHSEPMVPAPAVRPAPANSQVPLHVRMLQLKIAIDKRLFDAGLGDRVRATLAGNSLVLQGRLHPQEHQALLNRLRVLPDWAKVTDGILPAQ